MKAIFLTLGFVVLCTAVTCTPSGAQQERPAERPTRPAGGPGGGGGGLGGLTRMNPLFTALDANGDGMIDAREIEGAVAALKKLDKNGDGALTEDEVRFVLNRGVRGNPEMRESAPPPRTSTEVVDRLMQFDGNADGKLAKEEVPERMRAVFDRGDADKDGFLTREELKAIAETPRVEGAGAKPVAPIQPDR